MNDMNRKGFVLTFGIIVAFAIAVVILIFGISVVASKRLLITGIGVAGIVLSLIYIVPALLQGTVTKNKIMVVLIIMGVFGLMILLPAFNLLPQTAFGATGYIQAPVFATLQCQQSGASKTYTGTIPADGYWISRYLPKNTNEWSIVLRASDNYEIGKHYFEYYICPQESFTNCRNTRVEILYGKELNLGVIPSTSHVWVQYQKSIIPYQYSASSGASFIPTYKPFVLIRDDIFRGGRQELSSSLGCNVPTDDAAWLNRVVSTTTASLSGKTITPAVTTVMKPGEIFNYITGTVTRIADGNTQSGGYCIYNNGRATIFGIDSISTPSGSYNIVNVDKVLSYAQCCNSQSMPGYTCQNGQMIPIAQAECRYSSDCGSIEYIRDPSAPKTIYRYTCQEGKCMKQTRTVGCSTDSDCPTNSRCSTVTWSCQIAGTTASGLPVGGSGDQREDVIAGISDEEACQLKAKTNPLAGYSIVEAQTQSSFLGIKYGPITTTKTCKAQFVPYYIIGAVMGAILIAFLVLLVPKRKGRRK